MDKLGFVHKLFSFYPIEYRNPIKVISIIRLFFGSKIYVEACPVPGTTQDPGDTVVKKVEMFSALGVLTGYWAGAQVLWSYVLTIDVEDHWDILEVDSRVFSRQGNVASEGKGGMEDFWLGGESDSDITETYRRIRGRKMPVQSLTWVWNSLVWLNTHWS